MATAGPANYIYLAETCTDSALAVVIFINNFWALFENMTTEQFNAISPYFVFCFYGALTFLSVFFIYFYVGETKGLSEKEKKEIFMPGATWGRNLAYGEKPFAELGDEHKSVKTRKSEMLYARLSTNSSVYEE